ncbi:MAG: phosphatase PAP2 family protein [Lunatimonas sp.]|uniref:phosphatase PAP2 family protein n=1 Tax=Lunatimonas sp. TaxID=2060141 RepID=UPI00263A664E|nr:phosphatase PAP2 family protein [Lunatimonas sp.]MCC5937945.1 phosphatase PAP2 family protein [Lunatimonas sp.]
MIEIIASWDESLFLWLNALRADWLDPVMNALTGTAIWIPFYLLLVYFLIRQFRMEAIWYMVGLVGLILLADQFTSGFMKPYFERLRPCHDPRWEGIIFNYSGCGGRYGFASSHASNTFALATYFWLIFRSKASKWLFVWAAIISYTRVYLGVHYPADILVGALVGLFSGYFLYYLVGFLRRLRRDEASNPGKPTD